MNCLAGGLLLAFLKSGPDCMHNYIDKLTLLELARDTDVWQKLVVEWSV